MTQISSDASKLNSSPKPTSEPEREKAQGTSAIETEKVESEILVVTPDPPAVLTPPSKQEIKSHSPFRKPSTPVKIFSVKKFFSCHIEEPNKDFL